MGCGASDFSGSNPNQRSTKSVIITGANKGIGYAIVEKLLQSEKKYNIILTARDHYRGEQATKSLQTKYPNSKSTLIFFQLDVTSYESVTNFARKLKSEGILVEILINNAGVGLSKDFGDASQVLTPQEVDLTLATNVTGVINLTQTLLPFLTPKGKIITVSSLLGELSFQGDDVKKALSNSNWTVKSLLKYKDDFQTLASENRHVKAGFSKGIYQVSKALVNVYNRWVLKPQLKDEQTCFAVHPGWVRTDMGTEKADLPVEEGAISTIIAVNFSLEESLKYNGKYLWNDGTLRDY